MRRLVPPGVDGFGATRGGRIQCHQAMIILSVPSFDDDHIQKAFDVIRRYFWRNKLFLYDHYMYEYMYVTLISRRLLLKLIYLMLHTLCRNTSR